MRNTEGFWYSTSEPWLPMPQPYVGPWLAKDLFLERLAQAEAVCPFTAYRGLSGCRICGKLNGNAEFKTDDWIWPSGFRHYVEDHNVRPTPVFEKAILGDTYADSKRR